MGRIRHIIRGGLTKHRFRIFSELGTVPITINMALIEHDHLYIGNKIPVLSVQMAEYLADQRDSKFASVGAR